MGRRSCPEGHPNNTAIPPIAPKMEGDTLVCWKCGSAVSCRSDDVDEEAIDIRLNIYFDAENGTLASVKTVEDWAASQSGVKVIRVDGEGEIQAITDNIMGQLN